jgi:CHASE3 domain sensor protein
MAHDGVLYALRRDQTNRTLMSALSKRERSIAAATRRFERQKDKAESEYAKANRLAITLGQKIFKMRKARQLSPFQRAVRISEEGKHVVATAQYLQAQHEANNGGEALIWAHSSVKPFKISTSNKLD